MVLLGVGVWFKIRADRQFSDPHLLLARFPIEEAVVLSADLAQVRGAGLLPPSQGAPEPEYKQFLDATGFDYRHDLDSVVASFSASGNFYIARGRFNWAKLRDYAGRQGGSCYQDLCRMPGSTPQRRISFLPLRNDTIALAVSTDDLAANRLTKPGDPVTAALPSGPVWLSVPGSALHAAAAFPPGLKLMLSALTNADRLVVTAGPSGVGFAVKMDATCRSKDDARMLASQLRNVTGMLKGQSDELATVLAGGSFEDSGLHVNGQWPFTKELIGSLTSGI